VADRRFGRKPERCKLLQISKREYVANGFEENWILGGWARISWQASKQAASRER